ncbi:MAG: PspC domain-containing protein [Candidatus Altiarchaeota archaeon]
MANENEPKRLFRSRENRILGGVLGGVGEYLNTDPVAVRVAYVIAALLTGVGPLLVGYVILWFIIPERK